MKVRLLILVLLLSFGTAHSQGMLKKAKEKVRQGNKILRDIKGNGKSSSNSNSAGETNGSSNNEEDYNSSERNGRPSNTKGKKLSSSSIDVQAEIKNAENHLETKNYQQTRNSIQQAILGIEFALASKIIEELPLEVQGLKADKEYDHIAASGAGYQGLTLTREYFAEVEERTNFSDEYNEEYDNQKYLSYTLMNSELMLTGVNDYISNPIYSSGEDGDKKVIRYKEINCLLEFEEYTGYTLSIPVGTKSLVQLNAVNFEDEEEVLKAADSFDLEVIKKYLGE